MPTKHSIKAVVRDAKRADAKARHLPDGTATAGATMDSFVNLGQKLGVGADNATSTASYGYNPISRNRTLLEWMHRGSWIAGVAVDGVADDMTRAGIEFHTDLPPDVMERLNASATALQVWDKLNETIRWGRLYGGSICVALIDGQDLRSPLRLNTVAAGQFKGLLPLDRWMVDPSLEDLITDYGPSLGLPKYYRVGVNAPALAGQVVHHSRVMLRLEGVQLPHQQRLTENLWGISVLERLYDRMIAFDSATTGAAQLVYKSYLRTLKIEGFRDIVAAGGTSMNGLLAYVDVMRRFQGIEGITLLDATDTFEVQQHSAFSGLDSALNQFGQQLSGALQIPLVRLFGQSPAGLNSTGESDLRMYYDHINQQQNKTLLSGVTTIYRLLAASGEMDLPNNSEIAFKNLWQLQSKEKADIASSTGATVSKAHEDGLIGRRTALLELRQSSRITGVFSNITDELIDAADDEVAPPGGFGEGLEPPPPAQLGDTPNEVRPDGTEGAAPNGTRRRVLLQHTPPAGGKAD
jgi:uncharacterized protein